MNVFLVVLLHSSLTLISMNQMARAWQAGAGPGDGPLTIDLDSTICETYGLAKEGARHPHSRLLHPLVEYTHTTRLAHALANALPLIETGR